MRRKVILLNRPISPHLSIYDPQITSLSSIWHRISGVLIIFIIVSFSIFFKIIFNFTLSGISVETQLVSVLFIYLFILFLFLYHSLNGIRNILWDLSYGFKIRSIKKLFYTLCFCLFCILLINFI